MPCSAFNESGLGDFFGVDFDDAVKQRLGDAPFLALGVQGDGFVVEAGDLAALLLAGPVEKADDIADGDIVAAKSLSRRFPDTHVGAVEVDRGVEDEPAGFTEHSVDGGSQSVQLESRCLVQGVQQGGEVHDDPSGGLKGSSSSIRDAGQVLVHHVAG